MDWTVWVSVPGRDKRFLSSPKCPNWFWSLPSFLFNRCQESFLGFRWPGCETDHSHAPVGEVKLYLCSLYMTS
jgi:hypothetical protein